MIAHTWAEAGISSFVADRTELWWNERKPDEPHAICAGPHDPPVGGGGRSRPPPFSRVRSVLAASKRITTAE